MNKHLALAFAYTVFQFNSTPTLAQDRLDSPFRREVSSEIEWLYNIGTVSDTDGNRFSLFWNLLSAPRFEGWIPLTLIPILNFFAPPQLQLMILDHQTGARYELEQELNWNSALNFGAESYSPKISMGRQFRSDGVVRSAIQMQSTNLNRGSNSGSLALQLVIDSQKPRADFGRGGWVDNGRLGKAFYASRSRRLLSQEVRSALMINGVTHTLVNGTFWEDHQVVPVDVLEGRAIQWDWIALQFDDGTEAMMYRLNHKTSGKIVREFGEIVERDGSTTPLERIHIEPTNFLRSEGKMVPKSWTIDAQREGRSSQLTIEHDFDAPWFHTKRGLIRGQILEGPAHRSSGTFPGKQTQWIWAEHFDVSFCTLGL